MAPKDPHNYIMHAFEHYKRARQLTYNLAALKASPVPSNPAEAEKRQNAILDMESGRRLHVNQANLYMAMEEQWVALQTPEVFDRPEVKDLMARMSKFMVVKDAEGVHPLLTSGGNWADFVTRMGFAELPNYDPNHPRLHHLDAGLVFSMVDPHGRTHYYAPQSGMLSPARQCSDRADDGTISGYMQTGDAKTLLAGKPDDLPGVYRKSPLQRAGGAVRKVFDALG
jgi:hypothetical protein